MDLRQAVEDALEENPMLEEVSRATEPEDAETPAPAVTKDATDETEAALPDDWAAKDPLTFTNAPSDLSRRSREDTRKITDDRDDVPLRRPHINIGTEIEIPPNKYKFDASNPTGHAIVFLSTGGFVFCFVQGTGS